MYQSHVPGLFPWKFTSPCELKYVWYRSFGLATSMPELPPSPVTIVSQFGLPVKACVALSCVPPSRSFNGLFGLTETLSNCVVRRPAFIVTRRFGTCESHALQLARSVPVTSRESHCADALPNLPSVRITPPSEPTNAMSGLPGTNAIACSSGCMSSKSARLSPVMSFQLEPPSVERTTARPSDMSGPAVRSGSPYCITPPSQTVFGWPGGVATNMSYEHCASQKSNEP